MAGNRVDDLEETVRQLEATVNGLTDELMETKERLHALEDELEPDLNSDIIEGQPTSGAVGAERTEPADAPEPEPADAPEPEAAESAGGDKGGADDGEDNADSGSSDDIIVA